MKHTYATTAGTAQVKTMTSADLLDRMEQIMRETQPEPIGEWMRSQGRPPEHWRVVLPRKMRDSADRPLIWPDYVAFSDVLSRPVFIPRGLWAGDHHLSSTHRRPAD